MKKNTEGAVYFVKFFFSGRRRKGFSQGMAFFKRIERDKFLKLNF